MASWKLVVVLSVLCVAHAMYDFDTLDSMPAFSVEEDCDYAGDVCGPITAAAQSFIGGERYIFLGTGSGLAVMDASDPENLEMVDSLNLCPGSRSVTVSAEDDGTVTIWTTGNSVFCDCVSPPCHVFQVEINGELYDATPGSLSQPFTDTPLVGDLVVAEPLRGCDPLTNPSEVNGKIVMIERGNCLFTDKLKHALAAGAIAVIIGNNQFNDPFSAIIEMSGEFVDIPAVMVSKPSFATIMDMVAAGTVSASMGNTIGSDTTDPRFTEFQGLTKITFDGEAFSEPEFFTDAWDSETYKASAGSWLNEINHDWLITSIRSRTETAEPVSAVHDVSSGSPVLIQMRDSVIGVSLEVPTGDGESVVYGVTFFDGISDVSIAEAATVDDLENAEAQVTEITSFNRPLWIATSRSYDGEQFYYMPENSFGGGLSIVDTSYFPDFFPTRTFWNPDAVYDFTPCENAEISPEKDVLASGWASEGVAFFDITTRYNPEHMLTIDTYPDKEADHTVGHWLFPYSEHRWIVIPTHADIMTVDIYAMEMGECEPCEECEECECDDDNDHDGTPETVINFNFEGMIPANN